MNVFYERKCRKTKRQWHWCRMWNSETDMREGKNGVSLPVCVYDEPPHTDENTGFSKTRTKNTPFYVRGMSP